MQIIQSKISLDINSLLSNFVSRDYLVSRLSNSRQFTLITTPSGFGKTLLLAQFLKKAKSKFFYYDLSANDRNLYEFLHYYINSISYGTDELKEELSLIQKHKIALSKFGADNYSLMESILTGIFQKINLKVDPKFYSILENIDFIKKEIWFKHFIKITARYSKNKINFIFTGTHIPESLFIPAILNGQFSLIDKKDFDLSAEEINKFSMEFYKHKTSIEDCEQIKALVGGWISGLHLIFHSEFSKTHKNFTNRKNILFEYFASEILGNLSNEEKSLLLKISFLNEINPEILAKLIKNTKGKEVIQVLSKKIPFLFYDDTKDYFHFSDLFKEFLNKYYLEEEPDKDKKTFFDNCGKYYEEKNIVDAAFGFYEKSSNYKRLTDITIKNGLSMFRNGEFYIVNKWMNVLDKKILNQNETLLYIYALLFKNYLEDREESNELFNLYLKKADKNKLVFYKAVAHIAENLIYLNEHNKATNILKKYLKFCPDKYKPVLLFRLHSVNYNQYNFDNCSKYLHEALQILSEFKAKDRDSISLKNSILNALGNIFNIKGDFYKSIHYYNQVLELIDNEYNKFETRLNLCEANAKLGNFKDAYNILKELDSQQSLSQLPELSYKLKQNLMLIKYEEGNLSEALEIINSLSVIDKNQDAGIVLVKLKIYFIRNDKAKIAQILKGDEKLFKQNEILNIEFQILKNLYLNSLKNVDKLFDKLNSFELVLKEIELYSIVFFYLIRMNKSKAAEECFNALVKLNSKTKYFNIINSFLKNERNIYDSIISADLYKKYFREIYFNIGVSDFDFYDIKVIYFGIPEIHFRGEKLPDSSWKRNKFKDIFLYLYFNIGKRISKDELLERFYPEADKNYADNIFHQFLSNIRSVFPGKLNSTKAEFIIYRNKVFEVNPDYILTSDVKILERIIKDSGNDKKQNNSYVIKNYSEPFMKNYYDEFAESQRDYYENTLNKYLNS